MSHHAGASPQHTAPDVEQSVQAGIAKVQAWRAGIVRLHQALQHCANHPAESIYKIAGIHLLPAADMKMPLAHLKGMEDAIMKLDHAVAELGKAAAHALKPADAKAALALIEQQMRLARYEGAAAAHALQDVTEQSTGRDGDVAAKLLATDQAVIDKVPEIAGEIMLAITKKEAAKVLTEQGVKLGLNGVANASAAAQGIDISAQMPGLANASLDAGIEILAGLIPGAEGKVKAALLEMVKNIGKEIVMELSKLQQKQDRAAVLKGMAVAVNAGVAATFDKLAGEFPPFKSSHLREMVAKPVLKAFVAGEKAWMEGKPIEQAALAGFAAGLAGAKIARKGEAAHGAAHPPAAHPDTPRSPFGQDSLHLSGKPAASPAKPAPAAPAGNRPRQDEWVGSTLNLNVNAYPSP